ncbi:uncharacterized protein LOC134267722 [Saccostrea cucullata]|uniref:uncharacterized protein LOC134267722 n=1 Tax=Saccostrea cuccullata TaxID=36930 RepID=UPI002ED573AD
MYYGPQCEERTGTMEFVVGLSVGGGGFLLLVIILIICCRRSSNNERDKKLGVTSKEEEFSTRKLDMRDFTSGLQLKEDSKRLYRYDNTPGAANRAYELLWNQSPRVPELEMYPPLYKSQHSHRLYGEERVSMTSIDSTRNFSIKRPHIYSEPMENFESPYVSRESYLYKSQTGIRPASPTYTTTENRTPF